MSKIRREQDRLTVILLSQLDHGELSRGELLKKTLNHCGTRSKFRIVIEYLLAKDYVKKIGRKGNRSPYRITEKGRRQLALLRNNVVN